MNLCIAHGTKNKHQKLNLNDLQSWHSEDGMSLLSYNELRALQETGVITNSHPEQVNSSSIDITLGPNILIEVDVHGSVNYSRKEELTMYAHKLQQGGSYYLEPGEFILAQSEQVFNLPDWLSAEYKLKSGMARTGLNHLNAGWCDAGWNGSVLTLELVNVTRHHGIHISVGDRIGQMVFFRHKLVPTHASYALRGKYNGDLTVRGVKNDQGA